MTNIILKRHNTHKVKVGNYYIGGDAPILVQSMTNMPTADVEATTKQIIELAESGSEIVRITVNNDEAAKAVAYIYENLQKLGLNIPLVGCFHFNGHRLLTAYPECAKSLAKYRINPGNVGLGAKHDIQFNTLIEQALKYDKPVRIGVNWGSLDQELLAKLMDDNNKSNHPKSIEELTRIALIESALSSAKKAEEIGLDANKIILSCKVSNPRELILIYEELARKSNYALHLGLTEAGMGKKGIISTATALSVLLYKGIGDTIRASLTPKPGESRTTEVKTCQEILQSMGYRAFKPQVTSCPGCGRTGSTYFQELSESVNKFIEKNINSWKEKFPGIENLNIAVMGCIVNGPGESKHADIGISLPGTREDPIAPVFIDGKKTHILKGENIDQQFIKILTQYIEQKYSM